MEREEGGEERRGEMGRRGVGRGGMGEEEGQSEEKKETKHHMFSYCQVDRCLRGMHLWPSLMQGSSLKVRDRIYLLKAQLYVSYFAR